MGGDLLARGASAAAKARAQARCLAELAQRIQGILGRIRRGGKHGSDRWRIILMSAYNWIDINRNCPSCHSDAHIKCQAHYFSDYSGDDSGRFHDRNYRLGQAMSWWNQSDPKYLSFLEGESNPDGMKVNRLIECCYSTCMSCDADLYVAIAFLVNTPEKILDVGLIADWPANRPR